MCCNVETCCCCVDHKGGVKAIGLIFSLLILISLIASIVMLENRKAAINECADQAKASNGGVFCFDGTAIVEQSEAIAVQAWWADYYGYIMAANVVIQVIALLPNLGLVMAVVNGNRCLMLPWLILYMIYIVLWGIGLIPLIYLVVVVSAVAAAFGGLPQWQLILYTIGKFTMIKALHLMIREKLTSQQSLSRIHCDVRCADLLLGGGAKPLQENEPRS